MKYNFPSFNINDDNVVFYSGTGPEESDTVPTVSKQRTRSSRAGKSKSTKPEKPLETLQNIFSFDKNSILKAIIYSEILGEPRSRRGLRK